MSEQDKMEFSHPFACRFAACSLGIVRGRRANPLVGGSRRPKQWAAEGLVFLPSVSARPPRTSGIMGVEGVSGGILPVNLMSDTVKHIKAKFALTPQVPQCPRPV